MSGMDYGHSLSALQAQVDAWITSYGGGYFDELSMLAQLVEEVGEVARVVSRRYGDQRPKELDARLELGDELADVLFVLICLANKTGIDLGAEFARNLAKKTERDATRYEAADPDGRST
jgi:NTP pyrophosphatase (non-canonical NTP hydrolase)